MQEVHLSLFTGDSLHVYREPVRAVRSTVNLYNRSGIYRASHVVIRPIICITFKYTCFHIVTRLFHPFSYTKVERPIFGAGSADEAGAMFRES